jgi:alkylation response protein AidB-like acyl-CoA dehydrogenase
MVREMARSFAEGQIRPGAAERDRTEEPPSDIFRQMGEPGFLGMIWTEKPGGTGNHHDPCIRPTSYR